MEQAAAASVPSVRQRGGLITLDGNGRFLIPKRYQRMAAIEQDIKFVGMDDTIEIWGLQKAEEQQMSPEDFSNALEELMAVTE